MGWNFLKSYARFKLSWWSYWCFSYFHQQWALSENQETEFVQHRMNKMKKIKFMSFIWTTNFLPYIHSTQMKVWKWKRFLYSSFLCGKIHCTISLLDIQNIDTLTYPLSLDNESYLFFPCVPFHISFFIGTE